MGQLEIRIFGDPVLRQQARVVDAFDDRLSTLASDMHDTMNAAPGVGLAAPQVGVLKRLFTWGIDEETRGSVVNPVLTDSSEELMEDEEGCLSFPGIFHPVERPLRVEIDHLDVHGGEHTTQLEGYLARIWLHEMDHLNGILFIDHLAKHDRKAAMKAMRAYRREHGLDDAPRRPGGFLLGSR